MRAISASSSLAIGASYWGGLSMDEKVPPRGAAVRVVCVMCEPPTATFNRWIGREARLYVRSRTLGEGRKACEELSGRCFSGACRLRRRQLPLRHPPAVDLRGRAHRQFHGGD